MLSKKIKNLRLQYGKTQQELANDLNISRSTLAGYESESKQPSYEMLAKIASYFDVSVDYLLGLSDDKQRNNQSGSKGFFFFFFDDNDLQKTFVSALKDALETQNMTVSELCEKAEIDTDTCNQYLSGEHEPSLEHLVRLSKALDVSIDYLLGQVPNTSPAEKKLLNAFVKLNEDNQDIIIGKTKELLREQRFDNPPVAADGERKASGK